MVRRMGKTRSVHRPIKPILPHQLWVADKYANTLVQIFVAVLILVNFVVSALEAQLRPEEGTGQAHVFKVFEWFFGIIFTMELVVNLYGTWFMPFWKEAWNVFDFVIVAISLLSLCFEDLPGISVLRLFRAFRVFRLFKRIESLRNIIEASVKSVPGVTNVFVILTIIMAIWAIMGVNFFGEAWDFHVITNGTCASEGMEDIENVVLCETAARTLTLGDDSFAQADSRNFAPFGCVWLATPGDLEFNMILTSVPCGSAHEQSGFGQSCLCKAAKPYDTTYFQSFWPAMFTLFQVWTGDSWGGIARPLVLAQGFPAYLFFISYIFTNSIIMTNAVVAILIERFMSVMNEKKEGEESDSDSDSDENENVGRGVEALVTIHAPDDEECESPEAVQPWIGAGPNAATSQHLAAKRAALTRLKPLELVDEVRLNEPLDAIFDSVQARIRDELQKTKARLQEVRELARKAKRRKRGDEEEEPLPPVDAPPPIDIGARTLRANSGESLRRQFRDESKDESSCTVRSTATSQHSMDARPTHSPEPSPSEEASHTLLPGSIECSPGPLHSRAPSA